MRLGNLSLALTAIRSSGPSTPQIITAISPPVMGPLTSAQVPSDGYTAGTYASTAGTITSAVPTYYVNGIVWTSGAIALDDVVSVSVLVTDSAANTRTFSSNSVVATLAAPTFSVQPTFDSPSYTIGDTVTLTEGTAGPDATLSIEYFKLGAASKTGELSGLTWDSTGETAGTLYYKVRATNAGGVTFSNERTAGLSEAGVAGITVVGGYVTASGITGTTYTVTIGSGYHAGTYTFDASDITAGPHLLHSGDVTGIKGTSEKLTYAQSGLWVGASADGVILVTNSGWFVGVTDTTNTTGEYTQDGSEGPFGVTLKERADNSVGFGTDTIIGFTADAYSEPGVNLAGTYMLKSSNAFPNTSSMLFMMSVVAPTITADTYLFSFGSGNGAVYITAAKQIRFTFTKSAGGSALFADLDVGGVTAGDRLNVALSVYAGNSYIRVDKVISGTPTSYTYTGNAAVDIKTEYGSATICASPSGARILLGTVRGGAVWGSPAANVDVRDSSFWNAAFNSDGTLKDPIGIFGTYGTPPINMYREASEYIAGFDSFVKTGSGTPFNV